MFLSTNILCYCQFLLILTIEYFNIQSNLFKPVCDQHTCLEQTSVQFIQVKLINISNSETLDIYKIFFPGFCIDRFHSIARKTQALMIIFKCERLIQLKCTSIDGFQISIEGVDVVEWSRALDVRLSEWCCSVTMVWVQIPSREEQKFDSSKI